MSSESDLSVSDGDGSETKYSDDDDFVSTWSSSKKRRLKSPAKEGSKAWGKPDLSQTCLGALALFNLQNETGSTKDIRDFIMEQFPYYKTLNYKQWKRYLHHMPHRCTIMNTGTKDDRYKILTLNSFKCAPLKKKLEKELTKKMDSIKLTMSHPENFGSFLQHVRDYICTSDESMQLKPKLSVNELVQEVFGENFEIEMTIPDMATKIAEKYEYYQDQKQKSNLQVNIRNNICNRDLFTRCGRREQMSLWKLDVHKTGLPHPFRITTVPKPIRKLIEHSDKLFLLGNPAGEVANFYFEGHDPNDIRNTNSLNKIAVTTKCPPGRFKSYVSWMTCLDPSTCPFSDNCEECFQFIFGNSDQNFTTITQSTISTQVTREYFKRKALLPNYHIPARPVHLSDDEESGYADIEYDGQGEDSDPSDDDESCAKLIDSEPDENNDDENQPGKTCKGPLDFLLQFPNHEFRKENCLTLWTTNNRKLKRQLKNFPRAAYKDMGSKAKGMYPQMTAQAYNVFDSLRISLPFRKKYILRAQREGRLLDLPTPESSSRTNNFNIQLTEEECAKLVAERQLSTLGPKGEAVTITIQ